MTQINKYSLTIGTQIDSYYGSGEYCSLLTVTKMSDKTCVTNGHRRESWNTINTMIESGLYKIK